MKPMRATPKHPLLALPLGGVILTTLRKRSMRSIELPRDPRLFAFLWFPLSVLALVAKPLLSLVFSADWQTLAMLISNSN